MADNPDDGGDFPASSDAVAAWLPAQYTRSKIYLTAYDAVTARNLFRAEINTGCSLVGYFGHGAWDRLAAERLLATADMPALVNSPRLPLFALITCTSNRFDYPGYVYLGEALLEDPDGGGVATWGPTGLSLNDPATILAREFVRARFVEGEHRIGAAMRRALARYAALGQERFVGDVYVLLGDPATLLK